MPTSEIEKLERRYAENPQGLTFAPLAEVHRKNGDVARALELLRAGLELHPNYIPASIVLGRCQWDLGDLPAAESAFAHVLRLDDENVIALKSLADINERLERFAEAQRWLHRLVSIDRSNEEARQQLSRLEAAKESKPPPQSVTAQPERPAAEPARPEVKLPAAAAARQEPAPVELAPLDLSADIAEPVAGSAAAPEKAAGEKAETKSSKLEFLDTSEPVSGAEPATPPPPAEPAPLPGLISQEFVPPKEATYRLHPELTREFVSAEEPQDRVDVEIPEEVELRSSGAAEFRVPNAAEDFLDLAARMTPAREGRLELDSAPPAETPPTDDRRAGAPSHVAPGPTPESLDLEGTETKAEVNTPSYSSGDTKGQSVASFFQALLAARPPGNSGLPSTPSSPPAQSGAPTRPAQDALALSSVFGEEQAPSAPAVPASGPAKDTTVSFDDFFGSPGGPRPIPKGTTDPKHDDLDQFQSWLQNLKR